MEELKPCPFCGEPAFIHDRGDASRIEVNHLGSCALLGVKLPLYIGEVGMVNEWNNRQYENKIKADYEKEIERLKARLQASQEDNNKIRGRMHDQWMNQNKIKADAVRNTIDESETFLINFLGEDIRFVKQSDLELRANKLERGELD